MSKKNKELSALRRQVEILKAQLKSQGLWQSDSPTSDANPRPTLGNRNPKTGLGQEAKGWGPQNLAQKSNENSLTTNNPYLKKDLLKTLALSIISFGVIFSIYFFQNKIPLISGFHF